MTDEKTTEIEAAVFRRLIQHFQERTDVQNIDLMGYSGFCRNCLYKGTLKKRASWVWRFPRKKRRNASTACPTLTIKKNIRHRRRTSSCAAWKSALPKTSWRRRKTKTQPRVETRLNGSTAKAKVRAESKAPENGPEQHSGS